MTRKGKAKLSGRDREAIDALARAAKELEGYEEAVRLAQLASSSSGRRYPKPNLDSPLRLVIGSSR